MHPEHEVATQVAGSLDLEDLKRRAKLAGVYFDEDRDDAVCLLKKLNHLETYAHKSTSSEAVQTHVAKTPGVFSR